MLLLVGRDAVEDVAFADFLNKVLDFDVKLLELPVLLLLVALADIDCLLQTLELRLTIAMRQVLHGSSGSGLRGAESNRLRDSSRPGHRRQGSC